MAKQSRHDQEQAIARDLERCELAEALGDRKTRSRAGRHRKACFEAIHEMNVADGIDGMTDEELLAALEGEI